MLIFIYIWHHQLFAAQDALGSVDWHQTWVELDTVSSWKSVAANFLSDSLGLLISRLLLFSLFLSSLKCWWCSCSPQLPTCMCVCMYVLCVCVSHQHTSRLCAIMISVSTMKERLSINDLMSQTRARTAVLSVCLNWGFATHHIT